MFSVALMISSLDHNASSFDRSMAIYEHASVKSYTSLAVLNTGQAIIFTVALTACMIMAGIDIAAGQKTVGHFVMVNALMLQLFIPLNFMGVVYREIKQSLIDIERMMDVLAEKAEVADRPTAKPLLVSGGAIRLEFQRIAGHAQSRPTRAARRLAGKSFDGG